MEDIEVVMWFEEGEENIAPRIQDLSRAGEPSFVIVRAVIPSGIWGESGDYRETPGQRVFQGAMILALMGTISQPTRISLPLP
jgi:hypothetical protein